MKNMFVDNLDVRIYNSGNELGAAAAYLVSTEINKAIKSKGAANLILATGASQFTFLEALKAKNINWKKIRVFHLDEYIGIGIEHPASFRKYLKERILETVKPLESHFLDGDSVDLKKEIKRYESLLQNNPTDVACIGIGENGHIAFNDPHVADFNDSEWIKTVKLDYECRYQQYREGWFSNLDEVPEYALTLTIPTIMKSKLISCVVPEKRKSEAVYTALCEDISPMCPASVLRQHPRAYLFLDKESSCKLGLTKTEYERN